MIVLERGVDVRITVNNIRARSRTDRRISMLVRTYAIVEPTGGNKTGAGEVAIVKLVDN